MLGHKRVPSREGGIEVVVEELSVRMAARGCAVTLYNRRGRHVSGAEFDPGMEKQHEYRGVRIKPTATLDRRGLAALTASVSASFHAAFGPYDLVHYHAEGPSIMCWLPKLLGKKVVVTIHGLDHARGKWGRLASAVIRRGERNAVRYADAVIVLSESVRQYFRDTWKRETELIYNGASPVRRRSARRITEQYGLEAGSYLLYLGRLVPEKGLDTLITAYRETRTERKLVIAGGSSDTGGYVRDLHALAEGDDRILFTGFVQGEILEELYSNAYVYVLPSRLEGMPLSLLEAMTYGNCCLTSDIPECTDVTGALGHAFRAGDAEDLRRALAELCDHPETVSADREKSAAYILNRFSWDTTTERTLALYRRVLGGGEGEADS